MSLVVSEHMEKRRKQKFRRELGRALSILPSRALNNLVSDVSSNYVDRPSPDDFLEMAVISKFGNGNAISQAGSRFLLEFCLNVINAEIEHGTLTRIPAMPWGSIHTLLFNRTDLWNAAFFIEADSKLLPYARKFKSEEFIWASDISPYVFLDVETRAFGFLLIPMPAMSFLEFKNYGEEFSEGWKSGVDARFEREGFCRLSFPGFDSGPMEFISAVHIIFGPIDKLALLMPGRVKHSVSEHERLLRSGKVTVVQQHKRKNPLRLVVNNRSLTDHIVYRVQDADGATRYFGEGKRDRWKHVNSGVSHNWKINEHFFTRGQMKVEVIHTGLTKGEALGIERMLIRNSREDELWNLKDYEPFAKEDDKSFSNEEINSLIESPG